MNRFLWAASCAVCGLLAAPRAQRATPAMLGGDDVGFAAALVRAEQADLAETFCRVLLASGQFEAALLRHVAWLPGLTNSDLVAVASARDVPGWLPPRGQRDSSLLRVGSVVLAAGRRLLGIAPAADTFVGWSGDAGRAREVVETAAVLLGAARDLRAGSGAAACLAQAEALRGRLAAAADLYAGLFAPPLAADTEGDAFAGAILSRRPELLVPYLEWGACLRQLAQGQPAGGRERFRACIRILGQCRPPLRSPLWWIARREEIPALLDADQKPGARSTFRTVERFATPEELTSRGFDEIRKRLR